MPKERLVVATGAKIDAIKTSDTATFGEQSSDVHNFVVANVQPANHIKWSCLPPIPN